MSMPPDPNKLALLQAILPHVAFDGWSQTAFSEAVTDAGFDPALAKSLFPRGAVDLAIFFHHEGDRAMRAAVEAEDLGALRIRDKISRAIELRLRVIEDKEAVRRGTTLFSLPHMAAEGAKLIWGTADAIWDALDDPSRDGNWYSKRATLSAVYGSVVLFWLGDDSLDGQATRAFIDRRIEDVMRFEKAKATINANPLFKPFTAPMQRLMAQIKAPRTAEATDLPGMWRDPD